MGRTGRGLLGGFALVALSACQSMSSAGECEACAQEARPAGGEGADGGKADGNKAADLERQVELARRKLERAQMDLEQHGHGAEASLAKANDDLQRAAHAFEHFQSFDRPQRLHRAKLELQSAEDFMTEQHEEMQQLELMYEQDDLADKTKEIVLARGRRRLERAKERLGLQQKELEDQISFHLPEEERRLSQAVRDAKAALQRAEFEAKSGAIDRETAVITARQEIEKLERELGEARAAAGGGAEGGGDGTGDGPAPARAVAAFLFGQI